MKKRILALILAVVTALTVLPIEAFAYGGTSGDSKPIVGTDYTVAANGTSWKAGYRISVQFVDVSAISGYSVDKGSGNNSFENKSTKALKDQFLKCFPCGDEKAAYFFNYPKTTTYVLLGTEFKSEYNVEKEAITRFFGDRPKNESLNDDGSYNKWFESVPKDTVYDYPIIMQYATEYVSSSSNVNAYLNYLEYLCTSDEHTSSDGIELDYMDSKKVTNFFYPKDDQGEQLANATTLFHMLVLSKILGTGTQDIEEYINNVNAGKKITKVPIILIESLASFKDTNSASHCWTLAQWIARIKGWSNEEAIKCLYTASALSSKTSTGSTYVDKFLNPVTGKKSANSTISGNAGTLAWSSYGLVQDSSTNKLYGISSENNGLWIGSSTGYDQWVTKTNNASLLAETDLGMYPGYSFYWMDNPIPSAEPAEYNANIKAVWCDASSAGNSENGTTKIERDKGTPVGIEAHYAVYGTDFTDDSEISKWLQSNDGKSKDYTLEISVYNSAFSETTGAKTSIDKNTYYTKSTNNSKFKSTYTKNLPANTLSENGYKCDTLSYKDVLNFLKGDACVYFYSERYKDAKKKEGTWFTDVYATVSIYPTGCKDKDDLYPWSSDEVQTSKATLRLFVQGPPEDGVFNVEKDEEFSNKVFNQDGYYLYSNKADDWQTTMYVSELGKFVSETDGLDASTIGVVAITLSAQAAQPLFYSAKENNGISCTNGNNGLSNASELHKYTSPKPGQEAAIAKLEKEMARLYNLSIQNNGKVQTSSGSKVIHLSGTEAVAFRQMITEKVSWGITGYVNKGTWQNIEATLDMTFGISIEWSNNGKVIKYDLTPENDTVTKIYPCRPPAPSRKFAQNKYHVDAIPDAKVVQLDDTSMYDLGANGEKGEVSTKFTIGNKARYNSVITACKGYNKGSVTITITRADDDGSSGVFVSRGDKLVLGNASTFGLKRKSEDSNVWEWDGVTPIYRVLEAFAEPDAEFIIQDTLESGRYILSTTKSQITLCYKVEIEMNVYTSEYDEVVITWTPDPGQDTVSWLANVDLYFNSAVDANFAEIKEGSPTKETYEAMSGVPVTSNLYYATGGHEFVVNTSYQIQKFSPSRDYYYGAYPSACDESWVSNGDPELDCNAKFPIGGPSCKKKHKIYKVDVEGSVTCSCPCTETTDTISCEEAGCTVEGCTATHTKPHEHTQDCYDTDIVNGSISLVEEKDCTTDSTTWSSAKTSTVTVACSCPAGSHSYIKAETSTESCKGANIDEGSCYVHVSDDLKEGTLKSWSVSECKCCCTIGHGARHAPDVKVYTETWNTTMKDVYYTVITQCYVWRLAANYLTTNQDLIETDDVIYSEWLPTEDDISAPGYVYFWSCDKAHLKSNTGNILGRVHYYWHDGAYHFLYDMEGNVIGVEDYISLNATMGGSGFAGDIGKTWDKTLYTCDDCDCSITGGREGHTYDKLYEYYLKHIKDDEGAGQRFGMSVISDFLFYSANSNDVQSIYYNEYNLYAGTVKNTNNTDGKPLHDVAKFDCSITKGKSHTVSECTISASSGCYKTTIDYTGSEVEINDMHYTVDSKGFLWEKNTTCVGHKEDDGSFTIDVDDLARAGYNGLVDTNNIERKYKPVNVTNFTYSANRAIMKYWDDFYAEGYLYHIHKNGTSKEDLFGKSYDKGKYIHYCPVNEITLLPKPPEKQPLPFYLGMQDLDISDIAENGLYEFGKVENFYECLIQYDPSNKGHIYEIREVPWVGNASSPIVTKGFTAPTTYYYGDLSADNRYINEVIVYVPSAADIGIGISEGVTDFIDDRITKPSSNMTAINLEADGVINFPLVSVIQEIPDNVGSFATCVDQIGKGYGGYGSALDVVRDPHNGLQWVKRKWITVSNYVIVDTDGDGSFSDEHVYSPYEEIDLSIFDASGDYIEDYPFYLPEMAYEDASTTVVYYTSTINNTVNEDTEKWEPNNVDEVYSIGRELYRYHGAKDSRVFQAVGRIGNLTMVDTGDFRYSNFFKASTGEWLVPNVVYKVDQGEQVRVVIDEYDIFDRKGGGDSAWNTYGSQDHKEELVNSEPTSSYDIISGTGTRRTHYYALPLLPRYNNIDAFKDTPMRVGYSAYLDVETIGNYYSGTDYVTVEYSYYGMDKNNNLHPLDVYMLKDGEYVLINDFYNDYSKITSYPVYMNWENENERRIFTETEKERTEKVNDFMQGTNAYDMFTGEIDKVYPYYPSGNTIYQGDCNSSILGFDSRTFIGDYYYSDVMPGFPDNDNTNVGGYIPAWKYYRNSQKWYFSNGLPSSAVFVEAGQKCTKENIDIATSKYDKAVVTAIIKAHGAVWDLIHDGSNSWAKLKAAYPPSNPTPPDYPPSNPPSPTSPPDTPTIPPDTPKPPTVITIIPIPETSRDDVTTIGTH